MDANTDPITNNVKNNVNESNTFLKITQIKWLSKLGTEKFDRSMVIYLRDKKQAQKLFDEGIMEIKTETAYTKIWQETG